MKSMIPLRAEWTRSFPIAKKVRFPKQISLWNDPAHRQLLKIMGRILIALPALLGLLIIMQAFMQSDSPLHAVMKSGSYIGPANVATGTPDRAASMKPTLTGGAAAISANVSGTGS